jgi:hypothetical protein
MKENTTPHTDDSDTSESLPMVYEQLIDFKDDRWELEKSVRCWTVIKNQLAAWQEFNHQKPNKLYIKMGIYIYELLREFPRVQSMPGFLIIPIYDLELRAECAWDMDIHAIHFYFNSK